MDINHIKNLVQNYNLVSMDDIEQVIKYIVARENYRLMMECNLFIEYEDGGALREKNKQEDKYSLQIGINPLHEIKEKKEAIRYDIITITSEEKRKLLQEEQEEFIELILQTFHELKHLEQIYNIVERPMLTDDTLKMTQEKILNDVFPGLMTIYNYEISKLEIDAMMTSLYKTVEFLQEMGLDITPNMVFDVMRKKELIHLNYDLNKFGNTFESAMTYFNKIYHAQKGIKGFEETLKLLSDEEKVNFNEQCQHLYFEYKMEKDPEQQWNILVSMALIMKPELYNKYPLIQLPNSKTR